MEQEYEVVVPVVALTVNSLRFASEGRHWDVWAQFLEGDRAQDVTLTLVHGDRYGANRHIRPLQLWPTGNVTRSVFLQSATPDGRRGWHAALESRLVQSDEERAAHAAEYARRAAERGYPAWVPGTQAYWLEIESV